MILFSSLFFLITFQFRVNPFYRFIHLCMCIFSSQLNTFEKLLERSTYLRINRCLRSRMSIFTQLLIKCIVVFILLKNRNLLKSFLHMYPFVSGYLFLPKQHFREVVGKKYLPADKQVSSVSDVHIYSIPHKVHFSFHPPEKSQSAQMLHRLKEVTLQFRPYSDHFLHRSSILQVQ